MYWVFCPPCVLYMPVVANMTFFVVNCIDTIVVGYVHLDSYLMCWMGFLQSPDSAKVKEGLTRLQKRLKAEKKNVEDKEKKLQDQKQHITKLEVDLKNITDGNSPHHTECAHKMCKLSHVWWR